MAGLNNIEPNIYGSVQPTSQTWTVVTRIDGVSNAFVNLFITAKVEQDRVRVAVKPRAEVLNAKHYILYDTPISEDVPLQISNIGLNSNDEIQVWSLQGATAFNVTGVTLVNLLS